MKIRTVKLINIMIFFLISCNCGLEKVNIVGIWEGKIKFPGIETRIVFNIKSLQSGKLEAEMLKPDEHDNVLKVNSITLRDSNLYIEVTTLNGSFNGHIKPNNEIIAGQWKQGRLLQKLVLHKVTKIVKYARPQTPIPPYPYNVKEVSFLNKEENIHLSGTITWPNKSSSIPAVILIPGGGAHDRDYSILRHRPFHVIADYLTKKGVAVLRFDERGVGLSNGDRSKATCDNYSQDVLAGVRFLKTFSGFSINSISLIGHSEGGMIASVSAVKSKEVSFIVLLGSPGLSGEEYQYQFEETTGRAMGLSEEMVESKRAIQEKVFDVLLHEHDQNLAKTKIRNIYKKFYPQIPEGKIRASAARFLSPGFQYNLAYDPASTLHKVQCPVFAIYGEKDLHVPPEGNFLAMKHILEGRSDILYKVITLPGLNHFFQNAADKEPFEYGKIEETISPNVLELIGDWICEFKE